jgi:hypothetical protein
MIEKESIEVQTIERALNGPLFKEVLADNLEYWMTKAVEFCNPHQEGTKANSCLAFLLPLSFDEGRGIVDKEKTRALEYWLPDVIYDIATDAYFEDGYDNALEYLRPMKGDLRRGIDECEAFRAIVHPWVDCVLESELELDLGADNDGRDDARRVARSFVIQEYFDIPICRIDRRLEVPLSDVEQFFLVSLLSKPGIELHQQILSQIEGIEDNPHLHNDDAPDEGEIRVKNAPVWEVLERYAGLPIGPKQQKYDHPSTIIDKWTDRLMKCSRYPQLSDPAKRARLMLLVRDTAMDLYHDAFFDELRESLFKDLETAASRPLY